MWVSCDCHWQSTKMCQGHVEIVYIEVMYRRIALFSPLLPHTSQTPLGVWAYSKHCQSLDKWAYSELSSDCACTGLGLDLDSKLKNGRAPCHFCSQVCLLGLRANYLESKQKRRTGLRVWCLRGGESKVLRKEYTAMATGVSWSTHCLFILTLVYSCIDIIGQVITSFLQDASKATGWAFHVIGGGLNKEGEIKIAA